MKVLLYLLTSAALCLVLAPAFPTALSFTLGGVTEVFASGPIVIFLIVGVTHLAMWKLGEILKFLWNKWKDSQTPKGKVPA